MKYVNSTRRRADPGPWRVAAGARMNVLGALRARRLNDRSTEPELRPFREFLMFARPPRDDTSPSGEPWPREGRVRAGATASLTSAIIGLCA